MLRTKKSIIFDAIYSSIVRIVTRVRYVDFAIASNKFNHIYFVLYIMIVVANYST